MVAAVIATVTTFLFGTLMGWLIHWVLHQRWSGPLYRSHMAHHLKHYPPKKLLSETYRNAGKDDALFVFAPILGVAFGWWCLVLSQFHVAWWVHVIVIGQGLLIGALHDYTHMAFHLEGNWLHQFKWFKKLQTLHFMHHWNVRKNLGIVWFGWDRLFKTFRIR